MKFSYAFLIPLLLAICVLLPGNAQAQDGQVPFFQTYQHESGLGYHIFESLNESLQDNYIVPPYFGFMAITYAGRFTPYSFGPEAGVSVNFKGAVAFSLSNIGSYFVFNLPLTAEFNVGHTSTVESTSDIGGFFGAGLDFNYVNVIQFDGSPYFLGPTITGGARFYLRNTSNTFRLSRTYDITGNGGVIMVFSLTTNIGE